MKHSDLYVKFKELDAQERRELVAAVMAHGGEYVFISDKSDLEDYNYPIILACARYCDSTEDCIISRVTVEDGILSIYGYPTYQHLEDEDLLEDIELSHISFITDLIPATEEVFDVSEQKQ